jgi:hypothetical protein
MLLIYSISIFRASLANLSKKEKYGYHLCAQDICRLFAEKSFEDVWEMNYRVKDLNDIRIIKIRIPNSFQNLSSADGFRLIVCCIKKSKTIILLNIHPKRGKLAMLDQSPADYKIQLSRAIEELLNKSVKQHDIHENLTIIEEK